MVVFSIDQLEEQLNKGLSGSDRIIFHKRQKELIDTKARSIIINGGRKTGKIEAIAARVALFEF